MCNCNRLKRSPTTFSCVSTFSLPRPFLKPFLGSRHLFSRPFLATLRNVTKPYETFETLRNLTKRLKPYQTFTNLLKPFKTFQNLSKPFKTFPLQNLSAQQTSIHGRVTTQTAKVRRAPESPFMGLAPVDDWTKPRNTRASIQERESTWACSRSRVGGARETRKPSAGHRLLGEPCGGRRSLHLVARLDLRGRLLLAHHERGLFLCRVRERMAPALLRRSQFPRKSCWGLFLL